MNKQKQSYRKDIDNKYKELPSFSNKKLLEAKSKWMEDKLSSAQHEMKFRFRTDQQRIQHKVNKFKVISGIQMKTHFVWSILCAQKIPHKCLCKPDLRVRTNKLSALRERAALKESEQSYICYWPTVLETKIEKEIVIGTESNKRLLSCEIVRCA